MENPAENPLASKTGIRLNALARDIGVKLAPKIKTDRNQNNEESEMQLKTKLPAGMPQFTNREKSKRHFKGAASFYLQAESTMKISKGDDQVRNIMGINQNTKKDDGLEAVSAAVFTKRSVSIDTSKLN